MKYIKKKKVETPLREVKEEDFNIYHKNQKVVTRCGKCGKEIITFLYCLKKNEVLCNECQVFEIKEKNDNIPQKIKNIKFNCKKCGKEVIINKYNFKSKKELLCKKCQTEQTCLKKYGVINGGSSKEALEKIKKTKKEKYGDPYYTNREKCWNTIEERYGYKHNFSMPSVLEKKRKTYMEHYGVDNPSKTKEVREKIKNTCLKKYGSWYSQTKEFKNRIRDTCLEKYGVEAVAQVLEFNIKRRKKYFYDNLWFDSKPELAFWIYHKENGIQIEKEADTFDYIFESKEHKYIPDFKVINENFELKGNQFLKENGEWQNPYDHSQDAVYEAKHQCALKNNVKILYEKDYKKYIDWVENKFTKDFMNLFLKDIPFPYLNENLSRIDDYGLIQHFHKSIYMATKKGKPSPLSAWKNKELVKKVALNRLKYVGSCTPNDIIQGFSVTRLAPKISVFKPKLAERLIKTYLSNYDLIVDPFSGFSGRLLGASNCEKQYIGKDINEDHVKESNEIIEYKKISNCFVEVEDLITAPVREFNGALFTCPPYGGKEHWNENNDEIEMSCDEWIDLCLEKYKCKSYLFVVDKTEKYKDFIVENLQSKNGLFTNKHEYVILIKKEE